MKNKLYKLLIALLSCIAFTSFSQTANELNQNEFLIIHYYSFEGIASQDKLDALEQSLAKLDFVIEAKVKYKFEKSFGQITLVVKDKEMKSEGDKTFSPASIKQAIIKNGFTPIDHSVNQYERK